MSKDVNDSTGYIKDYSNNQQKVLEDQIANIVLRQQEIQNFMTTLEAGIKQVELGVQLELQQVKIDYTKVSNMNGKIAKSMELLTKMYDTYRAFEDTKWKYHKLVNDVNFNYIKLLEIEVRRLDEKIDKISDSGFMEMMSTLVESLRGGGPAKDPELQEGEQELLNDPEYKM